jgi:hypothetical protein
VNPGIRTSAWRSAWSSSASRTARIRGMSESISARSHSRMSVAIWSLRERAVCRRLPASPTSSVSRCSMLKWTSSRSIDHGKGAGAHLGQDLAHAAFDRGQVGGGNELAALQHPRVREGALDVEFGQALVETDRRVEALGKGVERLGEASRPALPAPPAVSSCCMEGAAVAKSMMWRV